MCQTWSSQTWPLLVLGMFRNYFPFFISSFASCYEEEQQTTQKVNFQSSWSSEFRFGHIKLFEFLSVARDVKFPLAEVAEFGGFSDKCQGLEQAGVTTFKVAEITEGFGNHSCPASL